MFEIIFLGTSASAPSVRRGLSAQVIKHNEHRFLIDCGEGTQRQILKSGIGFKKLNRILITHGHLDHILGLAGLFSTFSRWETIDNLEIYGGKYALDRIHKLLYGVQVIHPRLSQVKIELNEINPGVIFDEKDFTVTAVPVSHRGPDCFGYLFEEKARSPFLAEKADSLGVPHGPVRKKLVQGEAITLENGNIVQPTEVLGDIQPGTRFLHIGDTGETDNLLKLAKEVDALVIEATYLDDDADMARDYAHLTATQAATLAKKAGVNQLILTHISRRYRERDVRDEAQKIFPNTTVARDFDTFQIRPGVCLKVDRKKG
ncbi:MAG: ribonuclease Z [Chloroflexota bacterium]